MKTSILRLWNETEGAIVSAEIMLVASILVIGVITGLSSLRDSVVTELADVAQAIANINQSYCYSGVQGHHAFTGGGEFSDQFDFCDTQNSNSDRGNSKCIQICSSGQGGEGSGGSNDGHHSGGGKGW